MIYRLMSCLALLCSTALAKNVVDLHGIQGERAQQILQKYTPAIERIETQLMTDFLNVKQEKLTQRHFQCLAQQKKKLLTAIQREGRFAFLDLQTVYYLNDKAYTTLEIIDDPKSKRMCFVTQPRHPHWSQFKLWLYHFYYKAVQRADLITQMQDYEELVTRLSITHQLDHDGNDCPAYHCLASFRHPSLQPYWELFQHGVMTQKPFILNTLRYDLDPERRASAAFLVGHFANPGEIVTILSPMIRDPAVQVRNNVLRVIALTVIKAHLNDIDSMPYIHLLDSPYLSDRNKALTVLLRLVDHPSNRKKIMRYGRQSLVDLLRLSQPDNHKLAYYLLKKISNHSWNEHDYAQWQRWITHATGQ